MTRIRNVAILKHQPFWASKVPGDLLMGRVKKVSQIGLDKVQCVQVRVPEYRFYEFSKMFYRGWEFHWALDPDQKCGLADVILIKKAATEQEQFSSTVPYIVDKMVFKYGNLVDPITKRRNYLDKVYEDELVFRRQIVEGIYNDLTTEEDDSMTHETRRERMKQRIEQRRRRENSRRSQQENRKQKEEEDVNDEFGHSD